jgi:Arc/MetJ family transcription regulator
MCGFYTLEVTMPTNLALNDNLLRKAMKLGSMRTKRETVNLALEEFIERRTQKRILEIEGGISFRNDWDYKKDRAARESGR